MNVKFKPLKWYVNQLQTGKHFSYARYGDGEWHAILGDKGKNCDGHAYFDAMGKELAASLRTPYYHGTIPAVDRYVGLKRVNKYLRTAKLSDKQWYGGNVFVNAMRNGKLRPLVDVLRDKPFLYVGPRFLKDFCIHTLGADGVVTIPDVDCYLEKDHTLRLLRAMIHTLDTHIIGFSASMTTKVLIADLYPEFGDKLTMIDFGSVFDIFPDGGRTSRKYMRRLNRDELWRLNFGGGR